MTNSADNTGCVVTGVAGFVGSHLAERLLSLGRKVIGVDNFASGRMENMDSFRNDPNFVFYERSIAERSLLEDLSNRHPELGYCFHLAAIVSVPYSMDHEEETMLINYESTVALLREAEALKYSKMVFAGSAAEYGDDTRLPLLEEYVTAQTRQLSPYGMAKYLASRAVGASPLGVALRCFNIYGPRQDPSSPYSGVISRFADKAMEGQALTIFGDGLQTRDFVYVSDVVEAYVQSAGLGGFFRAAPSGIYNVGTGKSVSVLDLARIIQYLAGTEEDLVFLPERPGDIRHSLPVIDAIQQKINWQPKVTLEEGLRRTLQWAQTVVGGQKTLREA